MNGHTVTTDLKHTKKFLVRLYKYSYKRADWLDQEVEDKWMDRFMAE
jgi:hypothetical protein